MYVIDHDLDAGDYMAFNRFHLRQMPEARQQLRKFQMALAVMPPLLAVALYLAKVGGVFTLMTGLVMSVVLVLLAPRIHRRVLDRTIERLGKQGQLGVPGRHRVTVDDEGVHEGGPSGVTHTPWSQVRLVETPSHVYLYTQPMAAVIVPRLGREDQIQALLAQVRPRLVSRG